MPDMTRDEMELALRRDGMTDRAVERTLRFHFPSEPTPVQPSAFASSKTVNIDFVHVAGPELRFPIRFTLAWSALCSDNHREKASLVMAKGKPVPRKLLTPEYKQAREKVVAKGREAMRREGRIFPPLTMALSLIARVWVPGGSSRNDVCNFAKGVHDALQKIVYQNDAQLHDTRWLRMGTDVDHPRAEIEIRPL